MKRDLDLIRDILLRIEELPYGHEIEGGFDSDDVYVGEDPMPDDPHPTTPDAYFGQAPDVAAGHVHLLFEADYIEGHAGMGYGGQVLDHWAIRRLTAKGYDYLDSVRDPAIYRETKTRLGKVGGTATLEVVKALAQAVTAQALGLGGLGPV